MSEEVDITALKKQLYDKLLEEQDDNVTAVWHQHEIMEIGVVKELTILLAITNQLVNEKLFKVVQEGGELGWMLRSQAEARAYRSLSLEQELVYSIIDEGGSDGAWTKTIKARSNLHEAVYKAAIKHLESKAMIQDMKSVEHPTRKMYIKSSVRQSDKSTGGPWFSNGELDEAFIEAMAGVMYQYILGKSFYRTSAPKTPKKVVSGINKNLSPEEVKAARNKALGPLPSEQEPSAYELRQQHLQRFLPMPAGYAGYPDLQELTLHIENASYTDQTLSESEIKQILDLLMYDDRIEAIPAGSTRDGKDRFVYKVLRHSLIDEADKGTMANEVPCGRCPVFALCEEGGPVAPSNCEYFTEWLSM